MLELFEDVAWNTYCPVAQAQAREMMPRRSREAANLPRRPNLNAQRLLPAAVCSTIILFLTLR